MKKNILLILILLVLPFVFADSTIYHITTLDQCVGEASLRVRSLTNNTNNEVSFNNCTLVNSIWKCKCGDDTSFDMNIKSDVTNEYDVVIQYYFDKTSNDSLRKLELNDIKINTIKEKEKTIFKMPSMESGAWVIVLILFIFIFIGGTIFIGRWLYDSNKLDFENDIKKPDDKIDIDDEYELDEILKDI